MQWRSDARAIALVIVGAWSASAQTMQGMAMNDSPWMLMSDATLNAMFNHQGGPRGGDEFKAPNWWMGMASRPVARGQLTLTAMLSLDPATVGESAYREIFQL